MKDVLAAAEGMSEPELRALIGQLTGQYARSFHAPKPFVPGQSPVPVSGKVYGEADMRSLVDSALDFWLTTGRFNDAFEAKLAAFLGVMRGPRPLRVGGLSRFRAGRATSAALCYVAHIRSDRPSQRKE